MSYKMTCYNNINAVLAGNGLTFFDASTVPTFPAQTVYRGGELVSEGKEVATWRETAVPGVVEVIDTYSGRIYHLLGGIGEAEELALTIALGNA